MIKKKKIFLLVSASWGAVDWIIPVIAYIKDNFTNYHITTVIHAASIDELFGKNHLLRDLCMQCSDTVMTYKELKKQQLLKYKIFKILYTVSDLLLKAKGMNFAKRLIAKIVSFVFYLKISLAISSHFQWLHNDCL